MIDRHMTHEEDKPQPRHEVLLNILGNDICACGANEQRPYPCPKIEKPNKIEYRDSATLLAWPLRNTFLSRTLW